MRCNNVTYLLVFLAIFAFSVEAQNSPAKTEKARDENIPSNRITIDQLKRKMDAKEEIVIIDTRAGAAWIGSLVKIKGAIHMTTDQLESRMNELPKDREIIAYCT